MLKKKRSEICTYNTCNFQELGLAGDRHISKVTNYAAHTKYDAGQIVAVKPFQIRTFILNFKKSADSNTAF